MNTTISTVHLKKTAEEMAAVMVKHKVMGTSTKEIWNDYEVSEFVNSIVREAEDKNRDNPFHVLDYPRTKVRIVINFDYHDLEDSAGNIIRDASLRDVVAIDHPYVNRDIDYEALSQELGAVAGIFV